MDLDGSLLRYEASVIFTISLCFRYRVTFIDNVLFEMYKRKSPRIFVHDLNNRRILLPVQRMNNVNMFISRYKASYCVVGIHSREIIFSPVLKSVVYMGCTFMLYTQEHNTLESEFDSHLPDHGSNRAAS